MAVTAQAIADSRLHADWPGHYDRAALRVVELAARRAGVRHSLRCGNEAALNVTGRLRPS